MKTLIKRSLLTSLVLLTFTISGFTQKPILYMGNLDFLKGQTKINVQYNYDNMVVGKNHSNEQDYIDVNKAKRNINKPGSGDKWAEQWGNNRVSRNEQKFEAMLNRDLVKHKVGVLVGDFPTAPYTLILKTIGTQPSKTKIAVDILIIPIAYPYKVSMVDFEIWIVETNNKKNVLAIVKLKKDSLRNGQKRRDEAFRIQDCYGKCGTSMAYYFRKNKVFKPKREKS